MRKALAIIGVLLTATVLISGPAVAVWVFVTYYDPGISTYPGNIDGPPDGYYATLGQNDDPPVLGWMLVDLGFGNEMPNDQGFTVFANSTESEEYSVYVKVLPSSEAYYVGSNYDTADHVFTTPQQSGPIYRYILLVGESGRISDSDPIYGPDLDAVGWDKP